MQGFPTRDTRRAGAEDKLRELILYIAKHSEDDPSFGRTKLAKLLFWSDFTAYAQLGESITGAHYRKAPHGPMPGEFAHVIDRERAIATEGADYHGYRQQRVVARRAPQTEGLFSPEQLAIVDGIVAQHRDDRATDLSDLSHDFPGWRYASYGEVIPYFTVFSPVEPPSEEDVAQATQTVRELVAA